MAALPPHLTYLFNFALTPARPSLQDLIYTRAILKLLAGLAIILIDTLPLYKIIMLHMVFFISCRYQSMSAALPMGDEQLASVLCIRQSGLQRAGCDFEGIGR